MEMNMGKFSEKLVELLELAKKKKNVLDYQEIMTYFQDTDFEADRMEYLTFWKPVEWMCLGLQTVMQMI